MSNAELVGAARRGAEAAQGRLNEVVDQLEEVESTGQQAQQGQEAQQAQQAQQAEQRRRRARQKRNEVTSAARQKADELAARASEVAEQAQELSRRQARRAQQAAEGTQQEVRKVSRRQARKAEKVSKAAAAKASASRNKSGRGFPKWLALIAGAGAAYYAYTQLSGQSQGGPTTQMESAPDPLAGPTGPDASPTTEVAGLPSEPVLEDRVRTQLGQDSRTSSLPRLNVNAAEGTVFVRGAVPEGYDADQIRTVVLEVEGVRDVDVQVGTQP